MPNSFAEQIEQRLAGLGKGPPLLVQDDFDEENFGNAFAVFEVGQLRLHFLNDRGLEAVDVEISDGRGGSVQVPLENLAVAANLLNLEDLLYHYGLSQFVADAGMEDDPPTGPFLKLEDAFALLGEQWEAINRWCVNEKAHRRVSKIQETIQNRMEQSLSGPAGIDNDEPEPGEEFAP